MSLKINDEVNSKRIITKELVNDTKNNGILIYKGYDIDTLTIENIEKIWDKEIEVISKNIICNNIENAEVDKLYEISYKTCDYYYVIEYDTYYSNSIKFIVKEKELPQNVENGMFFRKVDGNYMFDKETTENVYNEMKAYEKELIEKQNEFLKEMRKEGCIYQISYLEDECEMWYTELKNLETGEIFQELDFPHDMYNHIDIDSLVKYEKGVYSIIEEIHSISNNEIILVSKLKKFIKNVKKIFYKIFN